MIEQFDIIEYLSGLTGFVFDKAVLKRIALERDVYDVQDYTELDAKTKELLKADLLFVAYYSPNVWASSTQSHGSYTKTIGGQTIYQESKEKLYNAFYNIYSKYQDEKLEEINGSDSNLQWINIY